MRGEPVALVRVDPADPDTLELWNGALDLAAKLPDGGWCMVGGLMVQLHAYRFGQSGIRSRLTSICSRIAARGPAASPRS